MRVGKRFLGAVEKIDFNRLYLLDEAAKLVKETASAKFDETVDASIKLNVDPRKADQNIRSTVVLPHGSGKTKKIVVISKADKLKEAEDAGADYAGSDDLIDKIAGGWFDFDVLIATPDMMKDLSKLGKVLGPKGLMPNPKSGTVTFDIDRTVKEVKSGKIEFRVDSYGIVHTSIGKASFDDKKLAENLKTLVNTIVKLKPASVKGAFVKTIAISCTMGPGIKLDVMNLIN